MMHYFAILKVVAFFATLIISGLGTAVSGTHASQFRHIHEASPPTRHSDRSLLDDAIRGAEHYHDSMQAMCALPAGVDHAAIHDRLPGTAPMSTLQRYGMVQPRLQVMRELMETRFGNRPNQRR